MNVTLIVYSRDGVFQGQTTYPAMRGITIEEFFKRNNIGEELYEVRVNGSRPLNTHRFFVDTLVRLTDVSP